MTVEQIREQFREGALGIAWDTSLASPVRTDITKMIQGLNSGKGAIVQLFTTTDENGTVRCGLEVFGGDRAFHLRLAESIRNFISREPKPDAVLISEGATICRLHDNDAYPTNMRLKNSKTFCGYIDKRLGEWIKEEAEHFAKSEKHFRTFIDHAFEQYLYTENRDGSGRANSYLRAIKLLEQMLHIKAFGFEDCVPILSVASTVRLMQLRQQVLKEQKKGDASPWVHPSIPVSYLSNGYCSAALAQLIEFLPQHQHAGKALDLLRTNHGDEAALAEKLTQLDPEVPSGTVHDPSSKDGKDRLRATKTRIGQHAFREVILEIYQNRCCLTGLDLPAVNRASHIIGWAERKDTRMDPRNGLCLSATYDAAFDRKLITFDEDYRLVLSRTIKEHVPSESLRAYFLSKEGQGLELPNRCRPLQAYLAAHRDGGDF